MKFPTDRQILAVRIGLATATIGIVTLQSCSQQPPVKSIAPESIVKTAVPVLAKQLQGKPVVVDIYASWCRACHNVAPVLSQLNQKYAAKATFVVLDVSDGEALKASKKIAETLGLTDFFNKNRSETATVAIIDPASGKITKQLQNNPNLAEYTSALDSLATRISGRSTP